mgnify:CR=1 FL=1
MSPKQKKVCMKAHFKLLRRTHMDFRAHLRNQIQWAEVRWVPYWVRKNTLIWNHKLNNWALLTMETLVSKGKVAFPRVSKTTRISLLVRGQRTTFQLERLFLMECLCRCMDPVLCIRLLVILKIWLKSWLRKFNWNNNLVSSQRGTITRVPR